MSNKKFEIESITLPAMGLIIVIGAAIFLFTKTNGLSGAESLGLQNATFWAFSAIFVLVAIIAGYFLWKLNDSDSTKPEVKIILLAIVLICLTAPFGKGCSSKADPVTSPNYQNTK